MLPTLKPGNVFIVSLLSSKFHNYQRGEVVVIEDGCEDYAVKRIIGLPGETVQILAGKVLVNGRVLREDYLGRDVLTMSRRQTFNLRENRYFVLGDNRERSYDSRMYGALRKQDIIASITRSAWAFR
jgi:signal peptidase I